MPDEKMLFYTSIAGEFDQLMNAYDLERRLEVIFTELLPEDLSGLSLLDMGCGTGWFTRRALQRGASVTSLDISLGVIREAKRKADARFICGSALDLPFPAASFDMIVSSEVIEHTPQPEQAVLELGRVLRKDGILALTCPNRAWKWLVDFGTLVRYRPFKGFENFPGYAELEVFLKKGGFRLEQHYGFHPFPFQIKFMNKLSARIDRRFGRRAWGSLMINQAIRACKN